MSTTRANTVLFPEFLAMYPPASSRGLPQLRPPENGEFGPAWPQGAHSGGTDRSSCSFWARDLSEHLLTFPLTHLQRT